MPNINRNFTGGLNLDDHEYRLPENSYSDALNVTRDSQGEGQDGVLANILGNTLVSNSLPTGVNKIIGGFADKIRNRYYYFNWNSTGLNGIYYYAQDTNIITKVLLSKTDSGGIDILKFNPSNKIYGVNIIYRDGFEGDLLYFNDGLNEPRVINVIQVYGVWLEEYISLAKAPPIMPVKPVYENDTASTVINTTVLDVIKTTNNNAFSGGITTDYVPFDTISSTLFSASVDKTEFTYTGVAPITLLFNPVIGVFYNFAGGSGYVEFTLVKNGVAITGSSQIFNAGFGGGTYSKSVSVSLVTGDVIKVKLFSTYVFGYPTAFFVLQGGTLQAVEQTTTSNAKVTVNNLRNSLFQFAYRYVYTNFEKSVWSSRSVVPLPNQPTGQLTEDIFTNNARISLSMSSGGLDVSKIEVVFRQFKDGTTSDWFLIDSFNKAELVIPNNDIYTYKFYNDGLYPSVDVLEILQLQDLVPQKANAQELINGNTPIYGGITEGFDKIIPDISVRQNQNTGGFFYDYNGLLFFAAINGNDSAAQGTTMKVYLYGTGVNDITSKEVATLNNGKATYTVNVINNAGNQIGGTATGTDSIDVVTVLTAMSSSLVGNGWTQVSLSGNILTMSFPTTVTILSSGTKLIAATVNDNTTSFANVFEGGYQDGIMYFDKYGRTNGTTANSETSYNTPKQSTANYCQPQLVISHRPPLWAKYFQLVRSNNTTYNKRLYWVSNAAYSSSLFTLTKTRYAYVDVSNIITYNQEIKATQGVVSYNFTVGDRIRFLKRYDQLGTQQAIPIVDYEVLGMETSIIINSKTIIGTFVKIYYPTADITAGFSFDGTSNFQNYEILLYSVSKNEGGEGRVFYEFGKCFGVGNAGTSLAYHCGLEQSQDANNPQLTPAIISMVNGDLFYRKRTVPIPYGVVGQAAFGTQMIDISQALYITFQDSVVGVLIDNAAFKIQNELGLTLNNSGGGFPVWADTQQLFYNKLTGSANSVLLELKSTTFRVRQTAGGNTIFSIYAIICTNEAGFTAKYKVSLLPTEVSNLSSNVFYDFTIDTAISVPPTGKVYIQMLPDNSNIGNTFEIYGFDLNIKLAREKIIPIIEKGFSDVYNIITNSNGRESVIDENARLTYFPTLVRFGQSYQADTSINGTNRFYPENFDTYDRGFGDIQRLHVRDRYLKVYQKLKVGNVPVLTQIVKDVTGNPLQANTDQLINKIQYYSGDFGIGDSPCSLAWDNFSDYFVDDFRGVVCRLSQDGITPISILYKVNAFFTANLKAFRDSLNNGIAPTGQVYSGDANVYGTFDSYTNKYIVALEEINRYSNPSTLSFHQDAYTLSFDEALNQWESYYSYKPEWLGVINILLLSFKNGGVWKHNSTTYCNFYGIQYDAFVEIVLNNGGNLKKTWVSLAEYANSIWDCPTIKSQVNTYGTTPQLSLIPSVNFKTLEDNYHSNFLRDINSSGGLVNGNQLKGNYLTIKLRKQNASQFYFINLVSVTFIDSPLNKQ